MSNKKVAIIMGSDSDLKVMQGASDVLKDFGVDHDIDIVSAHRTPEAMMEFAKSADQNGYGVIIAGAGGAAHLPGMVASLTTLPVIGVPVNITTLDGLDAFLSIAQMPTGVPVATVAIDNSKNAGILAAQILGVHDQEIKSKLEKFKQDQIEKVSQMKKSL